MTIYEAAKKSRTDDIWIVCRLLQCFEACRLLAEHGALTAEAERIQRELDGVADGKLHRSRAEIIALVEALEREI